MLREVFTALLGISLGVGFVSGVVRAAGSSEAPLQARVTIDTSKAVGVVPQGFLNACKYNSDPALQERAQEAGFGLLRIDVLLDGVEPENDDSDPHNLNMKAFNWGVGAAQYGADLEQVVTEMVAHGHKPMLILHRTQPWNSSDGDWRTPPTNLDEWAEAAAATVYHFNRELGLGIQYWEIWNEPNGSYEWTGTFEQYLAMAKVAAARMREVDGSIKIGGPAWSYGDLDALKRVLKLAPGLFDFISWHDYGTGGENSDRMTDSAILAQVATKYGSFARQLKKAAVATSAGGKVPELILGEFNVDWAEGPKGQARRTGVLNAVWTASVLNHLLLGGADKAFMFSLTECGIIGPGGEPTPAFDLSVMARWHLGGSLVSTEVVGQGLEAFTCTKDGKVNVWLINKGTRLLDTTVAYPAGTMAAGSSVWVKGIYDTSGIHREQRRLTESDSLRLSVPALSVFVVEFQSAVH